MPPKAKPGSPENPLPVETIASAEDPAIAETRSAPQWVKLLQPLTVDPQDDAPDAPTIEIPDGRCVRVTAARARTLIANGAAVYATARDLSIGASLARDLCPTIDEKDA